MKNGPTDDVVRASPAHIVRSARHKCGLTQQKFADEIGVSQGEVSRYESGGVDPPSTILMYCLHIVGLLIPDESVSAEQLADRIRLDFASPASQLVRSAVWQLMNHRR